MVRGVYALRLVDVSVCSHQTQNGFNGLVSLAYGARAFLPYPFSLPPLVSCKLLCPVPICG